MGNDDNTPLGEKKSGGVIAAPIWTKVMKAVLSDVPVTDFPIPEDIVFVRIDDKTGLLATEDSENAVLEAFLRDSEPTKYFDFDEME